MEPFMMSQSELEGYIQKDHLCMYVFGIIII